MQTFRTISTDQINKTNIFVKITDSETPIWRNSNSKTWRFYKIIWTSAFSKTLFKKKFRRISSNSNDDNRILCVYKSSQLYRFLCVFFFAFLFHFVLFCFFNTHDADSQSQVYIHSRHSSDFTLFKYYFMIRYGIAFMILLLWITWEVKSTEWHQNLLVDFVMTLPTLYVCYLVSNFEKISYHTSQ